MLRAVWAVFCVTWILLSAAPATAHDTKAGGASAPARPRIDSLRCGDGATDRCPAGEFLRLGGEHLGTTRAVVFLGGPGGADDQRAGTRTSSAHRVLVRVPLNASTGPIQASSPWTADSRSGPVVTIAGSAPAPPAASDDTGAVFPVRGPHDFGTAVNGFGGGRNHQGQDILAPCGTPVVAARTGTVDWVRWQSAAGNYVVITADDGSSSAYLHLLAPATVTRGSRVQAGQRIGLVGQTGRATACHLHFESWTAPGWYRGGHAVDPLPALRDWEAAEA